MVGITGGGFEHDGDGLFGDGDGLFGDGLLLLTLEFSFGSTRVLVDLGATKLRYKHHSAFPVPPFSKSNLLKYEHPPF